MTRAVQQNPSTYFMGCPCHTVYNMALKASEIFTQVNNASTSITMQGVRVRVIFL